MMKYTRFFIFLILFALCACEENYNFYEGPSIAHFAQPEYDYYVNAQEDPYLLPVYLTKVSSVDKSYTVELDLENTNADPDTDFSFDPQVNIPAGELKGYVSVIGNFDSLISFTTKKVAFKLTSEEGKSAFRNSTSLNLHKFCEYSLNDLSGNYSFKLSQNSAPYQVSLTPGINQLIAKDLYAPGYDIRIYITMIDQVTYEVSIPKQLALEDNSGEIYVKGSGSLNTCGKILTTQVFTDSENNEIQTTLSEFIKIQ
ncbi:hypothetical protein OO013_08755 [Mangrovivirga sp. M17]|uniref:DUF4843 domain-containing protein n=1 Tax=Mangrovivirga halotolerans TaxID=2993936 RepID=A0ABT3RRG2_9BACT|nr:hypothetical protein [Mangrovivirga halotolerans]MCX2743953.1 hypothetical protein [Mangrovivirga halotolerans]